jgi:hypothetical protein
MWPPAVSRNQLTGLPDQKSSSFSLSFSKRREEEDEKEEEEEPMGT